MLKQAKTSVEQRVGHGARSGTLRHHLVDDRTIQDGGHFSRTRNKKPKIILELYSGVASYLTSQAKFYPGVE